MKKIIFFVALTSLCFLLVKPVFADPGTLYQQEEGANDADPVEVDAAGHGSAWSNSAGHLLQQRRVLFRNGA